VACCIVGSRTWPIISHQQSTTRERDCDDTLSRDTRSPEFRRDIWGLLYPGCDVSGLDHNDRAKITATRQSHYENPAIIVTIIIYKCVWCYSLCWNYVFVCLPASELWFRATKFRTI